MLDALTVLLLIAGWAGSRLEPGIAQPSYLDFIAAASREWSDSAAARFRAGAAALRGGRAVPAARIFEHTARSLPGFADWAHLFAARARAAVGDTASVRAALQASERGLSTDHGWPQRIAGFRTAGDLAGAAVFIDRTLPFLRTSAARADAAVQLGGLRLGLADSAGAAEAFRIAMAAGPAATGAAQGAAALTRMRQARPPDRLLAARILARHGRAEAALDQLGVFFRSASTPADERSALRLEIARSLFEAGQSAAAEGLLERVVRDAGDVAVLAEARGLLGRVQIRLGRKDLARRTLEGAVAMPAPAAEALFHLADDAHDRGDLTLSAVLYDRLTLEHPESRYAVEAAVRLGILHYTAGRFSESVVVLGRIPPSGEPETRARLSYWLGLAAGRNGDQPLARGFLAAARDAEPASFYGLRSAELLGSPFSSSLRASPLTSDRDASLARAVLRRYELLADAGFRDEAAIELDRARDSFATALPVLYALAEELHGHGHRLEAVRLGRSIRRAGSGWNIRLLRIVYPLPFQSEIVGIARARGIDPFLVAGLIRQESLFEPAARSRAGAVGLMQILPATGRSLARKDGIGSFSPGMLTDPLTNLRLGTLYVADLLRQHDGSLPFMLAAYNAGPGRLTAWKKKPEAADPDTFMERIPFEETRHYVRTVQQNARIYAELYAGENDPR